MKHFEINELFDTSNDTSIVYNALAEDSITPMEDVEGQETQFVIDETYDVIHTLSELERQIRRIITTNDIGFAVVLQHGRKRILNTKSMRYTYNALQQIHQQGGAEQILKYKKINPYLDLLIHIWASISDLRWLTLPPHALMEDGDLAAEKFNQSLFDLREYVKCADFKARCAQWFTQSSNSFRSTKIYIEHMFNRYVRLLVIRLDFGFRVGSELRSDLLQCRECFQRMLNNREHNSLFKNQVGYIWRFEFGEKKGWHYHCIFFFDGSKSRQDITLGNEIGSYWANAITNGQGTYWNCNRYKERYELFKTLGVGMVHYNDELKREKLLQAAAYLCKIDQYLRQALPEGVEGVRTFGRGEISNRHTNQGRPRQEQEETEIG